MSATAAVLTVVVPAEHLGPFGSAWVRERTSGLTQTLSREFPTMSEAMNAGRRYGSRYVWAVSPVGRVIES